MVISQFEKVGFSTCLIIMVKTHMLILVSSLLSPFFLWFGDPDLPLSPKASTAGSQIIVSEASRQALVVWKVLILSFHNQRM